MNKYQLTVVISEKVSEADRKETLEAIKKSFGSLTKEDLWGVRSLSYDIKHMNKAYFAYFEFESEPETIITLDKNIRLNEDIIRYLLVRVEDKRVRKTVKKAVPAEKKENAEAEKMSDTAEAETKVEEKEIKKKADKVTKEKKTK